jgi:hypothetical protein
MREYGISTFNLFVDFKAACDSIDRTQLFKAMEEFQIPRKLRSLMEITLRNIRCKVKTPSGITYPFDTKRAYGEETLYHVCCLTLLWRKQ